MGGRGGLAPGVTRRPGEYSPYSLGGVPITQGKSTFNYQITVNGTKLTGAEIAAAIKKYDRQRGKTGTGGFVDLG
jgi:hypothetical protein